jgi:hypothetical protein
MAFNPNQPRDAHGRFGEIAASAASALFSLAGAASHASGSLAATLALKGFNPRRFKDYTNLVNIGVANRLHQESLTRPLTEPERFAIQSYSGEGFENTNYVLRKLRGKEGSPDNPLHIWHHVSSEVKGLDSAIASSRLSESLVLFRGVKADVGRRLVPGTILRDFAYQSTTLSKYHAESFLTNKGALVHIYAKKNAPALPASSK